ncbi:voltage-gated potassium channel [Piromyces finnis]|uniref:Voltage-gated potassium channel n=1 Tax=Piromyces finnis TaxID=1754191 RepID=A0A1Y1V9N3_9FUNG|nr:voltage-gated potassium channel [Piromyces finnis]|eukprot:ORX49302.1 voltage-gated potassium channel [Piromyces finnis]
MMKSTKKETVDTIKQTINVLTVLLYNSRLCSNNCFLNLINFMNFFVTLIAIYIFFISSIPAYRGKNLEKLNIFEYLITTYYIVEILIRYILYTFFDVTTFGRIDEFYLEKESILDLSERQYRVITVGNDNNSKKNMKDRKKKKKNFLHLIRFFVNKMEIICLLNIMPLFVRMIINKNLLEIYNDSKLSSLISIFQYTRLIRFSIYIINTRLSKIFKFDMLIKVFKNSKEGLISTFLLSIWTIVFFSNFFYFAETYDCHFDEQTETYYRFNKSNEREECKVQSIIDAYWWAVVTIQCIGYGDLTPSTTMGKIINGCIVLIANVIFSIPSAILTIEFLDLIIKTKKDEVIEKAVIKCESKIEKARKKNFQKELMNIISQENIQNNANTFIKYYSINETLYDSGGIFNINNRNNDGPANVIDLFKLKKSNNSIGHLIERRKSTNSTGGYLLERRGSKGNNLMNYHPPLNRIYGSKESIHNSKPGLNYELYNKPTKGNTLTEYIGPIKIGSLNERNTVTNSKILKTSELELDDPTTTIKYGLGDKLLSKQNNNPDLLKLNRIIKNQQYLNRLTTQANNYSGISHMRGNNSSYYLTGSSEKNRKNEKGEIAIEFKLGEVKYMSAREISKELYKLSMEYYAQCDDEFSEVDEQSGTLYLLMKGFEKTLRCIRKIKGTNLLFTIFKYKYYQSIDYIFTQKSSHH